MGDLFDIIIGSDPPNVYKVPRYGFVKVDNDFEPHYAKVTKFFYRDRKTDEIRNFVINPANAFFATFSNCRWLSNKIIIIKDKYTEEEYKFLLDIHFYGNQRILRDSPMNQEIFYQENFPDNNLIEFWVVQLDRPSVMKSAMPKVKNFVNRLVPESDVHKEIAFAM